MDDNIWSLALAGDILVAGTFANGLYRSSDNGISWTRLRNEFLRKGIYALYADGSDLFAGTSMGGLYRSTNDGGEWDQIGVPHTGVLSLEVSGKKLYAGTDGNGVFVSVTKGQSWSPIGPPYAYVPSLEASGRTLFAGSDGIYLSRDCCADWAHADAGLTRTMIIGMASRGRNVYAATYDRGVYRSTDEGRNWFSLGFVDTIVYSFAFSKSQIVAGGYGAAYVSSDYGYTWEAHDSGLIETDLRSIVAVRSFLIAGTSNGVFRSSNGAVTWEATGNGLSCIDVTCLAVYGKSVFAGTSDGIFLSTDYGSNWGEINGGLLNRKVLSLVVAGSYLYAGTNRCGVWRRWLPEIATIVEQENYQDVPGQFTLLQNYPNPFNPATTIDYTLPKPAHVQLTVYNLLGQEIETLVDRVEEAGYKSVSFDAANLTSGVYFYRLQTESYTSIKKMLLLR